MEVNRKIKVITADITTLDVDAIVNAANSTLLGGGGVDGAIHRLAGPKLLEECKRLGGCLTGEAKLTAGHNLKTPYVIHTVGPVWQNGHAGEEELLSKCYQNVLRLAVNHQIKSIAFPAISTGVYAFPKKKAAQVAVAEVLGFLAGNNEIEEVTFCCFDEETRAIYSLILT